ncbi:MAG: hypothetical protein ACXAC5_01685 [Promethearchaeota archaeon]|jgi:hypothetical protein
MGQPFFLIYLENGQKVLINERQVASVRPDEKDRAIVKMSNGDEFIVTSPIYDDWENDFHVRKF